MHFKGISLKIILRKLSAEVFMIVDITGVLLIPGKDGMDCPGNGLHPGIQCCCDECDYLICC